MPSVSKRKYCVGREVLVGKESHGSGHYQGIDFFCSHFSTIAALWQHRFCLPWECHTLMLESRL